MLKITPKNARGALHLASYIPWASVYTVRLWPLHDEFWRVLFHGKSTFRQKPENLIELSVAVSESKAARREGILTRQRQPKASARMLRERYLGMKLVKYTHHTGDELLDALIRYTPDRYEKHGRHEKHKKHRARALIREERVNTTIDKRAADWELVLNPYPERLLLEGRP